MAKMLVRMTAAVGIRESWRQRNPTSLGGLKQAGLQAVRVRLRSAGCMHKDQVHVKFRGKAKTKIEVGSVIIAGVSYRGEAATLLRGYLVFPRVWAVPLLHAGLRHLSVHRGELDGRA